jgi:hypothetical protein
MSQQLQLMQYQQQHTQQQDDLLAQSVPCCKSRWGLPAAAWLQAPVMQQCQLPVVLLMLLYTAVPVGGANVKLCQAAAVAAATNNSLDKLQAPTCLSSPCAYGQSKGPVAQQIQSTGAAVHTHTPPGRLTICAFIWRRLDANHCCCSATLPCTALWLQARWP